MACRDRVAVVHSCPSPGSEGDGRRRPPGGVCVPRRRAAPGTAAPDLSCSRRPEPGTAGGASFAAETPGLAPSSDRALSAAGAARKGAGSGERRREFAW